MTITTIKDIRTRAKMTQKEIAKTTDIPVRTLQEWEAGRRTPPKYVIRYIILILQKNGVEL